MTGDYLWDRSGWPDAELVHLERVLGRLGLADDAPSASWRPIAKSPPARSWRFLAALAATAAVVTLAVALSWRGDRAPALEVTPLAGTPTIASRPVTDRLTWTAGRWLETDAASRANIDLPSAGRVELQPGSRLGLVSTRPGDYRLRLARGTMQAVIWAPPGQVSVATPSSTAVDLGCVYSMTVDDSDVGTIEVVVGWVGFEWRGRESFIPAGAMCLTRPGLGPGTPHYPDTSDAFRSAIDLIDETTGPSPERTAALDRVLAEARARDVVTLWHLLSRVDAIDRDRVFTALAAFVPPPAGATRDAIRRGQRDALDAWWNALDLGTAAWWRVWKQQWRDSSVGK